MERRKLGNTDMTVSVLGFGGAEIGFEGASASTVERLLGGALDAGLNVIDTAECYVDSEEQIGRAAAARRRDYFLFTKCGHPEGYGTEDYSRDGILAQVERSLRRLRTDHVDLLQLHSCDSTTLRRGEAVEALEEARRKGHTRYVGYSGDAQAALYAIECGRFDTLQTSVSVADQQSIDLLLPLARERQMGVIAKRPIANAAWRWGRRPANEYHHEYWDRLQKLRFDFLEGDVSAAVGIALRFTLSQPGVHTAIVGTQNAERWQQNARLLGEGPLPPDRIERIRDRWREVAPATWEGQI